VRPDDRSRRFDPRRLRPAGAPGFDELDELFEPFEVADAGDLERRSHDEAIERLYANGRTVCPRCGAAVRRGASRPH
jgi:hypothetical protein